MVENAGKKNDKKDVVEIVLEVKKYPHRLANGQKIDQEWSTINKVVECLSRPRTNRNEDGTPVFNSNGRATPLLMSVNEQRSVYRIMNELDKALKPFDDKNKEIEKKNRDNQESYRKKVDEAKIAGKSKEEIDKIPKPGTRGRIPYSTVSIELTKDDARYLAERMLESMNDFQMYIPGLVPCVEYFENVLQNIEKEKKQ